MGNDLDRLERNIEHLERQVDHQREVINKLVDIINKDLKPDEKIEAAKEVEAPYYDGWY